MPPTSSKLDVPNEPRFSPVAMCIYCGACVGLTDEHIIPLGLGGTLVLPKASCKPCAEMTSKFEMRALRGFLDSGREAMGVVGRKAHKRVRRQSVNQQFLRSDGSTFPFDLPISESSRVMHLPSFAMPAFFDPSKPISVCDGIDLVAIETATFCQNSAALVQRHDAVGIKFNDRIDIPAFVRMLAKIAHGYCVAKRGLFPFEESPLIPIISGERFDARNWIGNLVNDPLPQGSCSLHLLGDRLLSSDDGGTGVAVFIKLFAQLPSPTPAASE